MGPRFEGACGREALRALRAASSSYTEPESGVGTVVSMDLSKLSLPDGKVAGVLLTEAVEGPLKEIVSNFEDFMLQDEGAWTAIEEEASMVPPYNDPLLRNRKGYLQCLQHLHRCGVLGFTSRCRGRVGAFTVSKKPKNIDGRLVERQRLVLDCRQTNLQFKPPPLTELGSLAALGRLGLKEPEELFIAGADIRDCFYAVNCPTGMHEFFCLASDLSREEAIFVCGGVSDPDLPLGKVIPCITVLPMGFSWSFYLIQALHEQLTFKALNIGRSSLILDGQPPPNVGGNGCVAMPYCDNVHAL
eukprot:s569_g30.t1